MKKTTLLLSILGCISTANAEYSIKIPLDHNIEFYNWDGHSPLKSNWSNSGSVYGCSNWNPLESSITINQPYIQTATDCKQDQVRSVQNREVDKLSGRIKNLGEPYSETQVVSAIDQRNSIGTKETWAITTPNYTEWTNNGTLTSCSNWTPATDTVMMGQSFTQTATDCQQPQVRSRQDREQETNTLEFRNKDLEVIENQILTVSSTRSATGTKENWVTTTPTYSDWTNNGSVYDCNWTPAQSTVLNGETFTQTANVCKQDQTRKQQNREQETTTLEYRNIGSEVDVNNTISINNNISRTSTGTTPCIYSLQTGSLNYWNLQSTRLRIAINNTSHTIAGNYQDITSIVINGITYRRGTLSASTTEYQICR